MMGRTSPEAMSGRLVRDVMTPDPVMLSPNDTVAFAAEVMRDNDVGEVFVADENHLVGVVSDRDVVVRCIAEGWDPRRVPLSSFHLPSSVIAREDQRVEEVLARAQAAGARRIPVVDGDGVVGVVRLADLLGPVEPHSQLIDMTDRDTTGRGVSGLHGILARPERSDETGSGGEGASGHGRPYPFPRR